MNNETERKINKLISLVMKKTYQILDDKMSEHEAYDLGSYDIADTIMEQFVDSLLHDEKQIMKLSKQVSKGILQKRKEREEYYKNKERKNRELWKLTKGHIPCLCGCGYYKNKTKKEVFTDCNSFVCRACTEKAEAESNSLHDLFDKDIYKQFNIN